MKKEIKILNDFDIEKVSGGVVQQNNIESDKNLYNPKIEGSSRCISCHKDFSYSFTASDPKSFEKQTFCENCRLERIKNIMVDPKVNS